MQAPAAQQGRLSRAPAVQQQGQQGQAPAALQGRLSQVPAVQRQGQQGQAPAAHQVQQQTRLLHQMNRWLSAC